MRIACAIFVSVGSSLLTHDRRRAVRVVNDLLGYRADEPAAEERIAAIAEHDVIDSVLLGVMHDLFGGMTDGHRERRVDAGLRGARLKRAELPLIVFARAFDQRFGLDVLG